MQIRKTYYVYLLYIIPGFQLLQQKHSLLGLFVALNFVINHQRDLWDLLNAVTYIRDRNGHIFALLLYKTDSGNGFLRTTRPTVLTALLR